MRCLASAQYTMMADILKPNAAPYDSSSPAGHWEWVQDPDSGAFIQVWVTESDDPETPEIEGTKKTVRCRAKTAMSGSIRAAEQFGSEYLNEEWLKIEFPFNADITLRDKITNIRTLRGQVLWSEEESSGNPPTTFSVFRVSPEVDGFGIPIKKIVLVKRAVTQ